MSVSHADVKTELDGTGSQLRIEGAFDALTVGEITVALDAVVAEHPQRVTVDLEKVPLLDSAGVRAIVAFSKRIKAQGGTVAIVHAHDQPAVVLRLLKVESVLAA